MIHLIIPVYNRLNYTKNCLSSIHKQINFNELNIIIVDDGSTDGTNDYIKKKYPQITLLKGTGNLFWGGAVNLGINYVLKIAQSDDWVLLVNNDVELKNDSIFKLLNFAKTKNKKAIVGSLTVDIIDKNTVIKSGSIVESWFFNKTRHVYKDLKIKNNFNLSPIEVDFITGRCLLHPINVFNDIGNYDSKYFPHYGGDDEFAIRAKKFGYSVFVYPSSVVYLNSNFKKNLLNKKKNFFNTLFSIKSSSNLYSKFFLTMKIVPYYAKITFFMVAVMKSIYIFFKNEN